MAIRPVAKSIADAKKPAKVPCGFAGEPAKIVNDAVCIGRNTTIIVPATSLLASAANTENDYEIMTGAARVQPSYRPGSSPALFHGETPAIEFPPRTIATKRSSVSAETSSAY